MTVDLDRKTGADTDKCLRVDRQTFDEVVQLSARLTMQTGRKVSLGGAVAVAVQIANAPEAEHATN